MTTNEMNLKSENVSSVFSSFDFVLEFASMQNMFCVFSIIKNRKKETSRSEHK